MCGKAKKPKVQKADNTIAEREAARVAAEEAERAEQAKRNSRARLNMPLDNGDTTL